MHNRDQPFEIAVRNKSSLTDYAVRVGVRAVNLQMRYDFAPIWGQDLTVEFDNRPEKMDWIVDIVDKPTLEGAAGWHTIDEFGRVISEVAVETGLSWTMILSHEVLECAGNASVAKYARNWRDGFTYALEVCDAVQATMYRIEGVSVSDFVWPQWFDAALGYRTAQSSHNRNLQPFEIARGGYAPRYTRDWRDATVGASALPFHDRLRYLG